MQRRLTTLLFCAAFAAGGVRSGAMGGEPPPVADAAESAYLTRDYLFVDAPQIENYLQELVARLIRAQPDAKAAKVTAPRVLVFSSDALDVFTDSKRNLLVSTGSLRMLESEDELAAVLGHELSHTLLKHPQQKDSLRAFPVGIDTLAAVSSAAKGGKGNVSGDLSAFGDQKLSSMQAANLLWSDLVAPAWNRKQERVADTNGFELMRNAGYDPSAFGSLFQKLNTAAMKRSQRLELLKKVLLRRATAAQEKTSSDGGKTDGIVKQLRSGMTEAAVESAISGVSSFNREYDSPDERQKLLATYASEHRRTQRPAPPDVRFSTVLRQGSGARLLAQDAAAIRALAALSANDRTTAGATMKSLLPVSPDARLAAPHLNLAVGAWYQANGRPDLGEKRARAWLNAKRPPAQAYVWLAYYQAMRKEWKAAIDTLESGRRRVGNPAPFLPHLVSLARASGQTAAAEQYTRECQNEDQKNAGAMLTAFLRQDSLPSGLYADCVRRLGHEPPANDAKSVMMKTLKTPVQAGKSLTQKLRDKLHRD